MAVNGWPLSIFDDEQGRMLLATLNSAYTPPDKATVERLTDELFEEMRVKVADVASLPVRGLHLCLRVLTTVAENSTANGTTSPHQSGQRMQGFERRAFIRAFTASLDKFNADTGIPLALAASRASVAAAAARQTERPTPPGGPAEAGDKEMGEDGYDATNLEGPAP